MNQRCHNSIWFVEAMIISIIIIAIASVGIWFVCDKIDTHIANSKWNNGICDKCGGKYEYVGAVGHYISTSYLYACSGCNKHIEIPNFK